MISPVAPSKRLIVVVLLVLTRLADPDGTQGAQGTALNAVAAAPKGPTAAAGGEAGRVFVWDIRAEGPAEALSAGGAILALCWSPDGTLLVAGTDRGAQLWKKSDTRFVPILGLLPGDGIPSAAISPDGQTLAVGVQGSGTLHFFSVATGRETCRLWEPSNFTSGMAYSPDGNVLATAGRSFASWEVARAWVPPEPDRHLTTTELDSASSPAKRWEAPPPQPVEYAAGLGFSPDGKLLAGVNGTGGRGPRSGGQTLRIWEAATGELLNRHHATGMGCVTFADDSKKIVTGSDDGVLRIWDAGKAEILRQWTGHTDEIRSVAAVSEGPTVLSASADGSVALWDVNAASALRRWHFGRDGVHHLEASPR